jgi:hypothetical protein
VHFILPRAVLEHQDPFLLLFIVAPCIMEQMFFRKGECVMIRKRRKAVAFIVLVVSMVLFAEPYQNKQKI